MSDARRDSQRTHSGSESASMSSEPWVSVDVVASHLGVTKESVYRWIERKDLPAHRVGKLWKFKLSDVDVWVREGGASQASSTHPPKRAGR